MEMFDKATFAQVPLELTGDPQSPVSARPGADGDYKVGTAPLWRLGKKMLGISVPMRFHAGEPFHAGIGLADDGSRPQGHGRGTGRLARRSTPAAAHCRPQSFA